MSRDIIEIVAEINKEAKQGQKVAGLRLPSYMSPKREKAMKEAVELIEAALDTKHVWNVDFKEIKDAISRAFSASGHEIGKEYDMKYPSDMPRGQAWGELTPDERMEYMSVWRPSGEVPYEIRGLKKFLRGLQKYDGPMKREYENWAEEWLVYQDALASIKPFIVKGRKIDPNKVQEKRYEAPRTSTGGQQLIKAALEKVVDGQAKKLAVEMADSFIGWSEGFLDKRKETETPYEYFGHGMGNYPTVNRLVGQTGEKTLMRNAVKTYELRPDANKIAKAMADASVKDIVERYLYKNGNKIGSIVETKKGLEKVSVRYGSLAGWGFNGEIDCQFVDGTSFTVRNKVVVKVSPRGKWFAQFPTTFHDVRWPDGSRASMLSEEQMNEKWAKA